MLCLVLSWCNLARNRRLRIYINFSWRFLRQGTEAIRRSRASFKASHLNLLMLGNWSKLRCSRLLAILRQGTWNCSCSADLICENQSSWFLLNKNRESKNKIITQNHYLFSQKLFYFKTNQCYQCNLWEINYKIRSFKVALLTVIKSFGAIWICRPRTPALIYIWSKSTAVVWI